MLDEKSNNTIVYLFIILGGILLFFPFLGKVALFDWDEINFAEIAREMIVTGDYLNVQIDYQPFWEKPPLFTWMQVLSMKLFGINEFAARFPNAVCGIVTLLILFSIGKKLYNQRMGMIWTMVYAGSVLPFFYFKSGIIDPWFNLFIFTGIYFAILYITQSPSHPVTQSPSHLVTQSPSHPIFLFFSGLLIGLAILTKGPVAFLIFGLTGLVYLIVVRFKVRVTLIHILIFFAGLALTGGSWFMMQIAAGNIDVVRDFIVYQVRLFSTKDAGHGGFPLYHVVVLMFGVFPASAFLFNGFKTSPGEQPLQQGWRRASVILLLTVVVLFEIVQTKIVHYSSLAYFPLTYLSSLAIYRVLEEKSRFSHLPKVLLITFTGLWVLVIVGLTIAGLQKEWLINSGIIKDPFAMANLRADVSWTGFEAFVVLILIAGVLAFFFLKKPFVRIAALFTATIIFTFFTLFVFTGRIEGYTQRAALDFYKQHSEEDCYINTLGFKSYAHLFYSKKLPQDNPLSYDKEWLLNGQIDKPAYFVYKMIKKDEYSRLYPQLIMLYEKNGFIFAARYPEKLKPGL